MKKLIYATLVVGNLMLLTGCFGGGVSTAMPEEPEDTTEYVEELSDDELEPNGDFIDDENAVSEEVYDGRLFLYEGVWSCDQYDSWIEVKEDYTWAEYNFSGDVVDEGTFYFTDDDELVLVDSMGEGKKLEYKDETFLFDNREQVSYSPSSIPAGDANYTPSMLFGEWDFQMRDEGNVEEVEYFSIGTFYITKKGDFTYEPFNGGEQESGHITIEYDEYEEGSKIPYYSFVGDSGFYYGFYCDQSDPDIYYEGNGGEYRMVRN